MNQNSRARITQQRIPLHTGLRNVVFLVISILSTTNLPAQPAQETTGDRQSLPAQSSAPSQWSFSLNRLQWRPASLAGGNALSGSALMEPLHLARGSIEPHSKLSSSDVHAYGLELGYSSRPSAQKGTHGISLEYKKAHGQLDHNSAIIQPGFTSDYYGTTTQFTAMYIGRDSSATANSLRARYNYSFFSSESLVLFGGISYEKQSSRTLAMMHTAISSSVHSDLSGTSVHNYTGPYGYKSEENTYESWTADLTATFTHTFNPANSISFSLGLGYTPYGRHNQVQSQEALLYSVFNFLDFGGNYTLVELDRIAPQLDQKLVVETNGFHGKLTGFYTIRVYRGLRIGLELTHARVHTQATRVIQNDHYRMDVLDLTLARSGNPASAAIKLSGIYGEHPDWTDKSTSIGLRFTLAL